METQGNTLNSDKIESHFIAVKESTMHYFEMGSGDPILFLHGMPISGFAWRHMLPSLSEKGRCIALDLIGMGESGKPDIEYRVFDHIEYLDAFIDQLGLQNITLVLHGWGSVIGLDYARRHAHNIKRIVFYEAHLQPITQWHQLSLPVQQFATLLSRPGASYRAIIKQNYFIEKLLPRSVIRELSEDEMDVYRKPFLTEDSRKPLWQYINDMPLGKGPEDVVALIAQYSAWLQKTDIPKLLIYATPGFMTTIDHVAWARDHFKNIQVVALDDALYLAQESVPDQFSEAILTWIDK